jgi:PAS domain S-box-containing protein
MNMIDMRTVMFSYIVSNAICAAVLVSLWFQNRRRSAGLNYWLVDFAMQFLAVLLIALRGVVPNLVSILLSNLLVIGGTILLYIGLEYYINRRSSQVHNYFLLAVFIFTQAYFTYTHPNQQARNIIFSLALLAITSQCAWLLLKRAPSEMRHDAKPVGIILSIYTLISLGRVFVDWVVVPHGNDFFQSGLYDTLAVMLFQMLFIGLTFGLFLMVNQRLLTELECDIDKRKVTEEALRISDERFSKAFHNSPDAIVISSISDGKIIQVNEGFFRLAGFNQEEIAGKTTIELNLWDEMSHRDQFVEFRSKVQKENWGPIRWFDFRGADSVARIALCPHHNPRYLRS